MDFYFDSKQPGQPFANKNIYYFGSKQQNFEKQIKLFVVSSKYKKSRYAVVVVVCFSKKTNLQFLVFSLFAHFLGKL